jgi:hypothetical protein
MELDAKEFLGAMGETMERLSAAAAMLERTAASLEQREAMMTGDIRKMVAAVEPGAESSLREMEPTSREADLARRLAQAEQRIAELSAQEGKAASVRKTLPASTTQLLAKQGITALDSIEAGALDAALTGLSLEQRIAVKAQLLRAGALA